MNLTRIPRLMGAPVAVVLATVVNASAFTPADTAREAAAPDLSWAVRCGATEAVTTRTMLARRAASTIRAIDRYFGAQMSQLRIQFRPQEARDVAFVFSPGRLHTATSHQFAAP